MTATTAEAEVAPEPAADAAQNIISGSPGRHIAGPGLRLAAVIGVENRAAGKRHGVRQNTAPDIGTTAPVSQEATDALATICSFDHTRLAPNEAPPVR